MKEFQRSETEVSELKEIRDEMQSKIVSQNDGRTFHANVFIRFLFLTGQFEAADTAREEEERRTDQNNMQIRRCGSKDLREKRVSSRAVDEIN